MTSSQEVARQIRESLGLPQNPTATPTVPIEGHIADFPFWSYSYKRSTAQKLHIDYPDGSFFTLEAPKGMPGPSFPGYLDCILYFGQRDLFVREYVEISVYKIFKTLDTDPSKGKNYHNFHRDMERAFALYIKTDRFRNPETGKRSHVEYFRALQRMSIAKRREGISQFYFDTLFLESLRSGYLKRLDFEFCLYLDKKNQSLARFLYSHLAKRLGQKSLYMREFVGFLRDVGLGYVADLPPTNRNQKVKQTLYPALESVRGKAFGDYGRDDKGNIFFVPLSRD